MRSLKAALVSLLAVACNTAERVDYVHKPTADLQDAYEISRSELAPFTKHGVVVYPFFKLTKGTQSMVVVRAVSPEPTSVHFTKAVLSGRDLGLTKTIELSEQIKPGVYRGAHVITTIEYAELDKLGKGKDLELEVRFKVGDAPADTLRFDITRVSSTQMVSH